MNLVQAYLEKDNLHWIQHNIFIQNWATMTVSNWAPSDQQLRVLNDKSQYRIVAGGRRVGKTELIVVDSICNAVMNENTECIILTQISKQASMLSSMILDRIESSPMINRQLLKYEHNNIYFTNGSSIKVKKYDRAVNMNLSNCRYLYIDEVFNFISQSPRFLTNIIEYKHDMNILVAGTPKVNSRENIDSRYSLHNMLMSECPMVTTEMIEELRIQYGNSAQFRMEVLGEFL